MKTTKTILLICLCICSILAVRAQDAPSVPFAIINVNLVDVESGTLLENSSILITEGKIKAIQSEGARDLKGVDKIIDLSGAYVIPGLIDSHVHLFRPKNRDEILTELLYSGVTSVRDMGGDARLYQSLTEAIANGTLMGPDIYYSATVFGPAFLKDPRTKFSALGFEPGTAPWMRVITDSTDLETVMIDAKENRVTGIKVYSNIEPELLTRLSEVARTNGLKVWSHSSIYPSKPSDAVQAKVDVISHSIGMIFELQNNMPMSFNEAIRNYVPLQDFKNTDASAPEFITLFQNMKLNAVIFEPTLSGWSTKLRAQSTESKSSNRKGNPTHHLSNAQSKMDLEGMDDWAKRITKAAYDNGVTIAAGTDFSSNIKWVQDEVILLAESGMANIDALRAATINNAKVIGIENTHGSIAVDKVANFLVLTKNPLENIVNIKSVQAVYKNGKEYKK